MEFDIANGMSEILSSDRYRKVFDRPVQAITKSASTQTKQMTKYESCIHALSKISSILDEAGLEKSATLTLQSLDLMIREAQEAMDDVDDLSDEEIEEFKRTLDAEEAAKLERMERPMVVRHIRNQGKPVAVLEEPAEPLIDPALDEIAEEHTLVQPDELPYEEPEVTWEDEMAKGAGLNDVRTALLALAKDKKDPKDKAKKEDKEDAKAKSKKEDKDDAKSKAKAKDEDKNDAKKVDSKAKVRNKPAPVFDATHPKVKDKKDHFPIDTIGRGRNALARSHQFSEAPPWWGGSLKELQNAVARAVHGKYPSIGKDDKQDAKKKSAMEEIDEFVVKLASLEV